MPEIAALEKRQHSERAADVYDKTVRPTDVVVVHGATTADDAVAAADDQRLHA